ncbi:PREDICTED: uncharacterized protein LOC104754276 [Camelina sativa]|uniref:Uncharacterized protein LOC104754276 n=1 Tax=Camelina sativa TaxID=90675 RepID=A0ABM0WQH7_CAMSA|nr:PREDICTED: uncharacterized protein LOC104754276 [Camelina sativa]
MGKPSRVSQAIFLLVILVLTTGETVEAKPWWKKIGDAVGRVGEAVGNYKAVEMGLSLKGGECVREIMSVTTNIFSEWCIAKNDPRAPIYMKIEHIPSDVTINSLLKKPVDYIQSHYPNFLAAWNFNKKAKRKPRRAL